MSKSIVLHTGREGMEELIKGGFLPSVVEWRRKMALVPQHVHDAHKAEDMEDWEFISTNGPYPGMGIMWYADHPVEHAERTEWFRNRYPNTESIWNKHYGPYGLNR